MTRPLTPETLQAYLAELDGMTSAQAAARLEEAIAEHPDAAVLYTLLAAHRMHLGEHDTAEAAYVAALGLAPDMAVARFQLGLLQYTSGRPRVAFLTWNALESLGDQHYLVLFKRGLAALAIDAFADATELLRQGIAANTENAPLNGDMQMLIGEIERHAGTATAGAAEPDTAPLVLGAYREHL